jgi:plastocyanin
MRRTSTNILKQLLIFSLFASIQSKAALHIVLVQDYSFSPETVSASVGDTIKWIWVSGNHTSTSGSIPEGALGWNAALNNTAGAFAYTVLVPGIYHYASSIHPRTMTGTIEVTSLTAEIPKTDANLPIMIYPQPFTSKLTVDLNYSNLFTDNVVIEVFDILGTRQYQKTIGDNVYLPVNLDLTALPRGVYFVNIRNNKGKAVFKVTKSQ